jgi:dTDP-glucose 4,6-dehydratase
MEAKYRCLNVQVDTANIVNNTRLLCSAKAGSIVCIVRRITIRRRKMTRFNNILITGCAGFISSHLAEHYLEQGCQVVGVDNLITGKMENIEILKNKYGNNFIFLPMDVIQMEGRFGYDLILHFASPASPNTKYPSSYFANPRMTIAANVYATEKLIYRMMDDCRFIFASTSEIYGDPAVTPQPESYTGNVDPYSKRSVYDEAKRMGETICSMANWKDGKNTGIVRIFNTYGERIPDDGRVISNFVTRGLRGETLEVYGGSQTRSFLYISDLIDGITKLAETRIYEPINIGSSNEISIGKLAMMVVRKIKKSKMHNYSDECREVDDPQRRQADTTKAQELLGWKETVSLNDGLDKTIEWFRRKE